MAEKRERPPPDELDSLFAAVRALLARHWPGWEVDKLVLHVRDGQRLDKLVLPVPLRGKEG